MITKTLTCDWCGVKFERTDYPSRFKVYDNNFCSKAHAAIACRESYNPTQGTIITNNGTLMTRTHTHPNRNKNNQVPASHLIMEEHLGRYLIEGEVVHHKDGNPLNNELSNLQLMLLGEHVSHHNSLRGRDTNGRFTKGMSMLQQTTEA